MRAIFVTGMQRSGTTWIARAGGGDASRLVHEPFNWRLHGDDGRLYGYYMKYMRGEDDAEFTAILHAAINGGRQPQGRWLPGRVVIKDVHCCLAVEAVFESFGR